MEDGCLCLSLRSQASDQALSPAPPQPLKPAVSWAGDTQTPHAGQGAQGDGRRLQGLSSSQPLLTPASARNPRDTGPIISPLSKEQSAAKMSLPQDMQHWRVLNINLEGLLGERPPHGHDTLSATLEVRPSPVGSKVSSSCGRSPLTSPSQARQPGQHPPAVQQQQALGAQQASAALMPPPGLAAQQEPPLGSGPMAAASGGAGGARASSQAVQQQDAARLPPSGKDTKSSQGGPAAAAQQGAGSKGPQGQPEGAAAPQQPPIGSQQGAAGGTSQPCQLQEVPARSEPAVAGTASQRCQPQVASLALESEVVDCAATELQMLSFVEETTKVPVPEHAEGTGSDAAVLEHVARHSAEAAAPERIDGAGSGAAAPEGGAQGSEQVELAQSGAPASGQAGQERSQQAPGQGRGQCGAGAAGQAGRDHTQLEGASKGMGTGSGAEGTNSAAEGPEAGPASQSRGGTPAAPAPTAAREAAARRGSQEPASSKAVRAATGAAAQAGNQQPASNKEAQVDASPAASTARAANGHPSMVPVSLGLDFRAGSQAQADEAETPASGVQHGSGIRASAEAEQQQQSSPSAAAAVAAAAAAASQRQQVNTGPATNVDAAGGGHIGPLAAVSHAGEPQVGAGLTVPESAQAEAKASITEAAPVRSSPSCSEPGSAQPGREASAPQDGLAMAGASPVPTAGAVAGTQDGVAAAAATVADEAQHVQRIIAVHLACEAEVHARTDIRQVDLIEEAAVLWKRVQGLPLCQAEAELAEQAALRASYACSAKQALHWQEAAAQLQAAAELAGPQLPDASEASPVEALQNTQAEGDCLSCYWIASGLTGDAAGMVLFEALQAEQGRAWRAVAGRHLWRRHGTAEGWLQRQLCIARVCLGLHAVDFEGAEPTQPDMDSPGKALCGMEDCQRRDERLQQRGHVFPESCCPTATTPGGGRTQGTQQPGRTPHSHRSPQQMHGGGPHSGPDSEHRAGVEAQPGSHGAAAEPAGIPTAAEAGASGRAASALGPGDLSTAQATPVGQAGAAVPGSQRGRLLSGQPQQGASSQAGCEATEGSDGDSPAAVVAAQPTGDDPEAAGDAVGRRSPELGSAPPADSQPEAAQVGPRGASQWPESRPAQQGARQPVRPSLAGALGMSSFPASTQHHAPAAMLVPQTAKGAAAETGGSQLGQAGLASLEALALDLQTQQTQEAARPLSLPSLCAPVLASAAAAAAAAAAATRSYQARMAAEVGSAGGEVPGGKGDAVLSAAVLDAQPEPARQQAELSAQGAAETPPHVPAGYAATPTAAAPACGGAGGESSPTGSALEPPRRSSTSTGAKGAQAGETQAPVRGFTPPSLPLGFLQSRSASQPPHRRPGAEHVAAAGAADEAAPAAVVHPDLEALAAGTAAGPQEPFGTQQAAALLADSAGQAQQQNDAAGADLWPDGGARVDPEDSDGDMQAVPFEGSRSVRRQPGALLTSQRINSQCVQPTADEPSSAPMQMSPQALLIRRSDGQDNAAEQELGHLHNAALSPEHREQQQPAEALMYVVEQTPPSTPDWVHKARAADEVADGGPAACGTQLHGSAQNERGKGRQWAPVQQQALPQEEGRKGRASGLTTRQADRKRKRRQSAQGSARGRPELPLRRPCSAADGRPRLRSHAAAAAAEEVAQGVQVERRAGVASAGTRQQRGRAADAAGAARGAHTNRGAAVAAADNRQRKGSERGVSLPTELHRAAMRPKASAAAPGLPQPASRAAGGACSPQAQLVAAAQLRCSEGAAHLDLCLQTQAGPPSFEAAAAAAARPALLDSPRQIQNATEAPVAADAAAGESPGPAEGAAEPPRPPAAGGAAEPESPGKAPGPADPPIELVHSQGRRDASALQQWWPHGLETQDQEMLPGKARGPAAPSAAGTVVSMQMAVPFQTQDPEYLPDWRSAAAAAAGRCCRGPKGAPAAQQDSAGEARWPSAGRLHQKAGAALHGTEAGPGRVPAEQQGASGGRRRQSAGRVHQMARGSRGEQPGSGALQRKSGSRPPAGVQANMPAAGAPPAGKVANPQATAKAAVAALLRAQNAAAGDAFAFPSSQSAPEDEVCPAGQAEAVQAQAAIAHHLGGTTRLQVPAQRMSPRAHLQSAGTPRHCRSPGSAGKAGQSPNVSPGLRAHRVAASAARLGSAIAEAATGERKATAALGRDVAAQAAARGPANPQPAAASPPRKVARKLAVPATGPGDSVVGGTRSARRTSDLHKLSPLQGRASADRWQRAGAGTKRRQEAAAGPSEAPGSASKRSRTGRRLVRPARLVISPRTAAAARQLESLPESADPAAMDTQGGDSEFQPSGWPSESESEDPEHDPDVLLREAKALGAEPSASLEQPDRDECPAPRRNVCRGSGPDRQLPGSCGKAPAAEAGCAPGQPAVPVPVPALGCSKCRHARTGCKKCRTDRDTSVQANKIMAASRRQSAPAAGAARDSSADHEAAALPAHKRGRPPKRSSVGVPATEHPPREVQAAPEGPCSHRQPGGTGGAAAQPAVQANLAAEEGTATFAGMTFLSSGFIGADTERRRLSALVQLHGGELADEPALCQRPEGEGWCLVASQQSKTLKFLLAHLHGLPIVKPQWVRDSVRAQRPLTYADPTKVWQGPSAARRPLSGLRIHAHESGSEMKRQQLSLLLELAGASLVPKLPGRSNRRVAHAGLRRSAGCHAVVLAEDRDTPDSQAVEQAARRQGIHALTRLELCDILVRGKLPEPLRLLQQGAEPAPDGQVGDVGNGLGSQPFHGNEAPKPQDPVPSLDAPHSAAAGPCPKRRRVTTEPGPAAAPAATARDPAAAAARPPGDVQATLAWHGAPLPPDNRQPPLHTYYGAFRLGSEVVAVGDFAELQPLPGEPWTRLVQVKKLWSEDLGLRSRMLMCCKRFFRPEETPYPGRAEELFASDDVEDRVVLAAVLRKCCVTTVADKLQLQKQCQEASQRSAAGNLQHFVVLYKYSYESKCLSCT